MWIKSSFCSGGECVEVAAQWHRSSFCGEATCVEVGNGGEHVHVRDAKQTPGPVLTFTREEWAAFVAGVKNGEFDPLPL